MLFYIFSLFSETPSNPLASVFGQILRVYTILLCDALKLHAVHLFSVKHNTCTRGKKSVIIIIRQ